MSNPRIGDASARQLLLVVAALIAVGLSLGIPPQAGAQQATGVTATPGVGSSGGRFGFGHTPTTAQIAAENIDVRPDGTGLPQASGTCDASDNRQLLAVCDNRL